MVVSAATVVVVVGALVTVTAATVAVVAAVLVVVETHKLHRAAQMRRNSSRDSCPEPTVQNESG